MFAFAARTVGGLGLGLIAAGSFLITGYLTRLELGIEQNALALGHTVEAQRAILKANESLDEMLQVTDEISLGLNEALQTAVLLHAEVRAVGEANQVTLALNQTVEGHNVAAANDLARVAESIRQMNRSAAAIAGSMEGLRLTAASDVAYLRAIAHNTARMNARTPGW